VPVAEFEEREYESAVTIELADGRAFVLSPGQVAEKVLGYDSAADPIAQNPVWEVLRLPRPTGVRLLPVHWPPRTPPPAGRLPQSIVSLILQYKRPTFLHGARAAQWTYWRCPYYRFERTGHQHRVLRRLERNLGGLALVRYAAPAFWQRGDLEQAHLQRTVLNRSGFVSPGELGNHRVWTYIRPGIDGRANPTARRFPFSTFETLVSQIYESRGVGSQELVPLGDALADHLSAVGAAARDREPNLRSRINEWVNGLRNSSLDLGEDRIRQLADIASIVTLTSGMGASWCILVDGSVAT
jgi:hypothetical protein